MRRLKPIDHGEELPIVDHLDELRSRLMVLGAAFFVAFGLTTWQSDLVLEIVNAPLPDGLQPITLGPAEPFIVTLKNSAYAALLLVLPVVLYQAYAFLVPAFGPRERKLALPLLLMVPVLFIAGVVFCYVVVLPPALDFLLSFNASEFNTQVRASDYYDFATLTMLAMGLGFQVPVGVLVADPPRRGLGRPASPQPPLRDPGDRRARRAAAHARPDHARARDGAPDAALRGEHPAGAPVHTLRGAEAGGRARLAPSVRRGSGALAFCCIATTT